MDTFRELMVGVNQQGRKSELASEFCIESRFVRIMEICSVIGAKIVYMGTQSLVIEYFGEPEMVQSLLLNLRPMGIQEVARTGELALQKEQK